MMKQEGIEVLTKQGFSEAAIPDINQVAGYLAFANRLAEGLGVEFEPYWGQTW